MGNNFYNGFVFQFINGGAPTAAHPPAVISTDNIHNFGTGSIATYLVVEFDIRGSFDKGGGVNIFPNPVVNELQVQIPSNKKELVSIQIEDTTGKIVQTKMIQLNGATIYTSFNTRALVPGVYLLHIKKEDTQEVKRFIKQ